MSKNFTELGLGGGLVRALEKKGYTQPTPIQAQAIPEVLEGSDLLATAQTGTGKTASFALPILQMLSEGNRDSRDVRALILTPTRELAEQIDRNIKRYASNLRLGCAVLVGGVPIGGQRRQLQQQPAIVVATPGRLLDMLQQKMLSLSNVEALVLDEADRMLDMGFVRDVKKIVGQTPRGRQTLLFSATMSKEVIALSRDMLRDPKRIEIAPESTVADNLAQSVFFVPQAKKRDLLTATLKGLDGYRVLVFTRTKHRANRLAHQLSRAGISADAIHSNKSQNTRRRTLAAFDKGKVKVLVATDVVARGIDVKEISHVINYELPDDPENYVHRIGRTARAKQSGAAYSFCDAAEIDALRDIERLTKQTLHIDAQQPYHCDQANSLYSSADGASARKTSRRRKPSPRAGQGGRNGAGQRRPSRRRTGQGRPNENGRGRSRRRGGQSRNQGAARSNTQVIDLATTARR